MTKSIQPTVSDACLSRIREILAQSRSQALQAVNSAMVRAYWEIGREIVEEEQRGADRAGYGEQLLANLGKALAREFGKSFSERNLRFIRSFYTSFPIRNSLRSELTWTHYRLLSRIEKPEARAFYEVESVRARWSTRELERQINSLLFERLALSRDKEGLLALSQGNDVFKPEDIVRDPYVLEFTGLPEVGAFQESDLEQALMDHLQKFLLELGRGFAFVGRQKRVTLDGDHFYVDLVFYHTILKCFVLIDLKTTKIAHADLGQMQFYVNYYDQECRSEGDQPTLGIVLGAEKNEAMVRYTLGKNNQQIFASRYKLYLPTEEELVAELRREREEIEQEKALNETDQA